MEKRKITVSLIFLHAIVFLGIIGYMITENLSFFDSLWLAVVSILTIGYGDIAPVTKSGKVMTLILIPIAIGLTTYMLAQFAGAIISGKISSNMRRRKMNQKMENLNDHLIICGYGRVGQQVFHQLHREKHAMVIIERDPEVIKNLPEEVVYVEGNATEDDVLLQAGLERAKGVVVTLPNDADNVFITVTVKGIKPDILTVVRAEREFSEEKLYRAGADKVINTSNIGGKRMATAITKPISVEYVETILHDQSNEYNIEEILVSSTSHLRDKTLKESRIREEYGINIVAIKRDDQIISNPSAAEELNANDLVIVFGKSTQLKLFEKAAISNSHSL
ncbi:voltage-gated potassium channel [Thalassobacillus cyri]|uniref:Voltage-gated potassium channel n=1 Tax=Thalassobacillus cyri TaxID=571932 RepID=A0A1H3ZGY0_9BACI|nr:potassium channel protein [Thalassobacillus cyri]SEA22798.1 voltage-gated potassium channel [Thalassobacillus cyri]